MPKSADITYHPHPGPRQFVLPAGACDGHCHVFGPVAQFPYALHARFRPGDATKETLFALHDRYGFERCVVVQSGCHGFDNSATADAVGARSGRYVGIALLPHDVADADILALKAQGFRGIRFNYMAHLNPGPDPKELATLAARLVAFDWHLQIHMDSSFIEPMTPYLSSLPVPVVIDHMGRIDASLGLKQPAFEALKALMRFDNMWVKVSCCERASRQESPYVDAVPFARELVASFPERVLWGTDWPHPNFRSSPPDDADLVALLQVIAPTDDLLNKLLVDNPMRLYQFQK
jgi:2-pyrone-4,6-dicarboxylate lactonase